MHYLVNHNSYDMINSDKHMLQIHVSYHTRKTYFVNKFKTAIHQLSVLAGAQSKHCCDPSIECLAGAQSKHCCDPSIECLAGALRKHCCDPSIECFGWGSEQTLLRSIHLVFWLGLRANTAAIHPMSVFAGTQSKHCCDPSI